MSLKENIVHWFKVTWRESSISPRAWLRRPGDKATQHTSASKTAEELTPDPDGNKLAYGNGMGSGWAKNLLKGSLIAGVGAMGVYSVAHLPALEKLWENNALGAWEITQENTNNLSVTTQVSGTDLLLKTAAHGTLQGAVAELDGDDFADGFVGGAWGNLVSAVDDPIINRLWNAHDISYLQRDIIQDRLRRLVVEETAKAVAEVTGTDPFVAASAAWQISEYNHKLEIEKGQKVYFQAQRNRKMWFAKDLGRLEIGTIEVVHGQKMLRVNEALLKKYGSLVADQGDIPRGLISWDLAKASIAHGMIANYSDSSLSRSQIRELLIGLQRAQSGVKTKFHSENLSMLKATVVNSEFGHSLLEVGGMVPVVGEVFDVANGVWYYVEGDVNNGALSIVSAVPLIGYAGNAGKLAIKQGDHVALAIKQGDELVPLAKPTGSVASGAGGKIPWGFWDDYGKVTVNGRTYAQVGNRLFTKHAVDRMTPSGLGYAASGSKGRSVSPNFIEDVLTGARTTRTPVTGPAGEARISHNLGSLEVITEGDIVITVITH